MKITAWNTEGRLSRFTEAGERGSPEQILRFITQLDSDIVFLSEAFDNAKQIEPAINRQLDRSGYECLSVAYSGKDNRQHQAVADPHMILLSRLEVVKYEEIRPGDIRSMIMADIVDSDTKQRVRFFCIHLDDTNEQNRLRQIDDLVPLINNSPMPIIVMGDFNAMHAVSLPAYFFRNRLTRAAVSFVPHANIRNVLQRLSEMAIGGTLQQLLKGTNLVEIDQKNRPTTTPKMRGQEWLPSIRLAQIDHIFVSPEITTSNFQIAGDGGSDHRAISAYVSL